MNIINSGNPPPYIVCGNAIITEVGWVVLTCDVENAQHCPRGYIDGCILLGNELLLWIAFIAACFVDILLVVSHPVRARSAGRHLISLSPVL